MRFKIREMVATTVAATIAVLPILLYLTGVLSLVSIPANILILLFIPIAMLFIFFTGILGFISPLLSIPFGFISYLFLHYELGVINILSSIPFASFTIPNFPLVLVILIYAYFVYRLFGRDIKKFFSFEK